jgi:hypothetical protein
MALAHEALGALSLTADGECADRTGVFRRGMSTYTLPTNKSRRDVAASNCPRSTPLNKSLRSLRIAPVLLFVLGVMNGFTAQTRSDFGGVSTALCLCVCAAGLFAEDRLQRDLREDRRALVYVAAHPKTNSVSIARDLRWSQPRTESCLQRLRVDGLVACDDEQAAVRTYSLSV